ncbi:MAG: alpha/beta fold hydrolase, partial [Pseudomonadota bacterium]
LHMAHEEDIVAVAVTEEIDDIVLVGHSYGGAVVTHVADTIADKLTALIFLDAYIAKDGQSLLDADPPARQEAIRSRIEETPNGAVLPCPPAIIYGLHREEDVAWVNRRQTPHPAATYTERLPLGETWRTVPRLGYIATTGFSQSDFRDISASLADDPAFRRAEIATGHDAMIDAPQELAALLLQLTA